MVTNSKKYSVTNTEEDTTHSAAPSKCIHSSTQKVRMDMTGTGKQNITSKHHTITALAYRFKAGWKSDRRHDVIKE
jgi:hypothetical protein